jgi:hypothetical protein
MRRIAKNAQAPQKVEGSVGNLYEVYSLAPEQATTGSRGIPLTSSMGSSTSAFASPNLRFVTCKNKLILGYDSPI